MDEAKLNGTVPLFLAIILTTSIGFYVPLMIDRFNDDVFSNITILDEPLLLRALTEAQDKGVLICIHGWRHEDFSALTPFEAKNRVEKSLHVFEEAGLIPVAFLTPYMRYQTIPPSVKDAIESTGIATSLPRLQTNGSGFGDYGWEWRDMESFADPRYAEARNRIMAEQPTTLLLHVQDWNQFSKQLVCDYLQEPSRFNITVRIDDPEVNTPAWKIYDMAELLNYESVGQVAYGVIPAGTWRGGDPTVLGVSVNGIMRLYWSYYLLIAFFPFSFFLFWRTTSIHGNNNGQRENPSPDNPGHNIGRSVSVIVPAYNEEKNIGKCIESILEQEFNGEVEIIVVNDGSTDRTAKIASKYPVKLVDLKTNLGKANALNIGIKNSKGDILVFSDSDSHISANALDSLVRCLEERHDVGAVAGNVFINDTDGKENLLRYFQMIEYRTEQEINRYVQSVNGNVLVCPGPLFAVRRSVAEDIMFCDKSVIEDADFTIKVLKKSLRVIREPKAKVHTEAPSSLGKWFNQRKRWWFGNLQLWKIHKQWAVKNSWMILNYIGFITSLSSLILMVLLPYFFSTYNNIIIALLRGMAYAAAPPILFTVFAAPFFIREKKLLLILPFYSLIYSTMKVIMVSYLYLRYLSGKGVSIVFGPRIIKVK